MPKKKSVPLKRPKINLAVYALTFVVILIILGKVIRLLISFGQPITPSFISLKPTSPTNQAQLWNGQTPSNILIKSSDLSVLNYNPHDRKFTLLAVPSDTYFQLPKGYGSWPIGSVFNLGQEETPPRGSSLLKDSMAALLAQPIDRFLLIDGPASSQSTEQIIDRIHQNILASFGYYPQIKTDMTPLETLTFLYTISQARADKIVYLDLSKTNITESKLLPDSTRVLGVDRIQLDLFVRDKLIDDKIVEEAIPISIYNATNHPGLAQDASRLVTNLGGNVILSSNTENQFASSSILVMNGDKSSLSKSYTYRRLSAIYAPSCTQKLCALSDPKLDTARAQIIIVLGEDYYQQNYQHD